jgi:hypothetical protein
MRVAPDTPTAATTNRKLERPGHGPIPSRKYQPSPSHHGRFPRMVSKECLCRTRTHPWRARRIRLPHRDLDGASSAPTGQKHESHARMNSLIGVQPLWGPEDAGRKGSARRQAAPVAIQAAGTGSSGKAAGSDVPMEPYRAFTRPVLAPRGSAARREALRALTV